MIEERSIGRWNDFDDFENIYLQLNGSVFVLKLIAKRLTPPRAAKSSPL